MTLHIPLSMTMALIAVLAVCEEQDFWLGISKWGFSLSLAYY